MAYTRYVLLFAILKKKILKCSKSSSNYTRHSIVIVRSINSNFESFFYCFHVYYITEANSYKFLGQSFLYCVFLLNCQLVTWSNREGFDWISLWIFRLNLSLLVQTDFYLFLFLRINIIILNHQIVFIIHEILFI
jgi:hypothetical protein